jgi:hypothetical protein
MNLNIACPNGFADSYLGIKEIRTGIVVPGSRINYFKLLFIGRN